MATEREIRRELEGEREQLSDAVADLRSELGHAAGRANGAGSGCRERVEVELERAPRSLELLRMQLAQPSFRGPCRLAGMEQRQRRLLERRLELHRRVDLLDRPLRVGDAAVDDAG